MEALIPVLGRFIPGWPNPEATIIKYVSLEEALTTKWSWDAHTAAYSCPEIPYRLNKAILARQPVNISTFQVDFDAPDKKSPAEWKDASLPGILDILDAYPGGFLYETRGGFHLIYRCKEIAGPEVEYKWKAIYEHLTYISGINIDPCMAVWNQLFRLPFVVRDGVPQKLRTWGCSSPDLWSYEPVVPPQKPTIHTLIDKYNNSVESHVVEKIINILTSNKPIDGERLNTAFAIGGAFRKHLSLAQVVEVATRAEIGCKGGAKERARCAAAGYADPHNAWTTILRAIGKIPTNQMRDLLSLPWMTTAEDHGWLNLNEPDLKSFDLSETSDINPKWCSLNDE